VVSQASRIFVVNNEFGDFQTPRELARRVLATLPARRWATILDPTCGTGNFLHEAAARFPAAALLGIEVQPSYARQAATTSATIIERDIFSLDLRADLPTARDPVLVIGNPPWVTNAHLGRVLSGNRPRRENLRNLPGMAALTGASNFDIAECVWLKLLRELPGPDATISLLCKTQVARNVLGYCHQFGLPVAGATMRLVNARKWFGVAVDACLFTITIEAGTAGVYTCACYESLEADAPAGEFGVVGGRLIADISEYERGRRFDGRSPLEWRQGIKHDATAAMELARDGGRSGRPREAIDIEPEYLYPLLKSTDLHHGRIGPAKWVVVPQRRIGEDTAPLADRAPKLWAHLTAHSDLLDQRKSSIYRGRPRFSVFGIGDYSFAPYKVAVSGLHKSAEFRLVGPIAGKPVFVDDTCYLLPFHEPLEAAIVVALLRGDATQALLRSVVFWDAKRPITKKLLQRVDLAKLARDPAAPGSASRPRNDNAVIARARSALAEIGISAPVEAIQSAYSGALERWDRPF
jgi:hypothetical protein